jgi:hypothetical protein
MAMNIASSYSEHIILEMGSEIRFSLSMSIKLAKV